MVANVRLLSNGCLSSPVKAGVTVIVLFVYSTPLNKSQRLESCLE